MPKKRQKAEFGKAELGGGIPPYMETSQILTKSFEFLTPNHKRFKNKVLKAVFVDRLPIILKPKSKLKSKRLNFLAEAPKKEEITSTIVLALTNPNQSSSP